MRVDKGNEQKIKKKMPKKEIKGITSTDSE
jgi:hypothetical protein